MPRNRTTYGLVCWLLAAASCAAPNEPEAKGPEPASQGPTPPREPRRVILMVLDGFRADMLNETDTPRIHELARRGVRFSKHHSVFPCTTLTNAGALATGSYPQRSGWWGEKLYVPTASGTDARGERIDFTQHVDARDWATLKRLDEAHGGRLLVAPTLFKVAKAAGLTTAVIGKAAATFIQDMDFPTYFIDTDTAAPLAFARELQARGYALPPQTPRAFPDIALPPDYVNPYAAARPRLLEDGLTSDPSHPEARPMQIAGYEYFLKQYLEFVLPEKKPDLTLLWMNEPDATMHTYGPGSPQYRAALKDVDRWVAQVVARVEELGLAPTTDIIVTADHGATTISGHGEHFPLRAIGGGRPGLVDHDHGWSVSGQAILVEPLRRAGFKAFNGRKCVYNPLMTGLRADGSPVYPTLVVPGLCDGKSHTSAGYPLPPRNELPGDAVLVMETAGGDFLYVPGGDRALVARLVRFLQELPEIGAIFVNSRHGDLPGTLPLREIMLEKADGPGTPDLAIDFWSDPSARVQGVPGIGYHNKPAPAGLRGDHGALAPQDVAIPGVALGPDFRQGFIDPLPTGNVDIAPTIAHLLGLDPAFIAGADGRVLHEALRPGGQSQGRPETEYAVTSAVRRSTKPATGLRLRRPGSPDGQDLESADASYELELNVSMVTLGARSYRYVDSANAVRSVARMQPLRVGARWIYRVRSADGSVREKTSTVTTTRVLDGAKAGRRVFEIETRFVDDLTVGWIEDLGAALVRHGEQRYKRRTFAPSHRLWWHPYKTKIDEAPARLRLGTSWDEQYTEEGGGTPGLRRDRWTVEAIDEPVTVPAGAFRCVRLRRDELINSNPREEAHKVYWFAPGVGKVKELADLGNRVEELVAYQLR